EWGEPPFEVDFTADDRVLTLFPNFDLQSFFGGAATVIQVLTPTAVDETVVEVVILGMESDDDIARRWKLERGAGIQGSWGKVSADDLEAGYRTHRGSVTVDRFSNMGRGVEPGKVGATRDEYSLRSFHFVWREYMGLTASGS